MDETKLKYVRLGGYDEFIIFPMSLDHSTFRNLMPISAGFCHIDQDKVSCFGRSVSLCRGGLKDDTRLATKQVFGLEAMIDLLNN